MAVLFDVVEQNLAVLVAAENIPVAAEVRSYLDILGLMDQA